ncbi:MAG: MFS transporter [Candidatus Ancillula sp.]|nr:MFS transporter [Candidatus Ancillula sp.]
MTEYEVHADSRRLEGFKSSAVSYLLYIRNTPRGILLVSIFILGFIMRGPIAAVAPIADTLASKFATSSASIGALSGIPLLCFAAFAPVASYLIGKKGLEFTLLIAAIISMLGITFRAFGNLQLVVFSTILIGASIGLQNICIPILAARDFPKRFALATGINSVTMNLGNVFATAFTAPLVVILGLQLALLSWILLVAVFLIIWIIYIYRRRRGASRKFIREEKKIAKAARRATSLNSESFITPVKHTSKIFIPSVTDNSSATRKISKLRFTYSMCIVFSCQCFAFFGLSAWLPSIFRSLGMDTSNAGAASSIFQLFGIFGSICVVPLLKRLSFTRSFIIIGTCWILLPLGLLFAPKLWFIWLMLAGFAQSGNYIITFSKISAFSKNQSEIRKFSAVIQMVAYALASTAPSVIAAIHDYSGHWSSSLWSIALILTIMLVAGIWAHSLPDYKEETTSC